MKKTYINPTMKVVKVKTRSLFAASDPQPVVSIAPDSEVEAGEVQSRHYNVWGDEEEE